MSLHPEFKMVKEGLIEEQITEEGEFIQRKII